jgi:hypothetical protein
MVFAGQVEPGAVTKIQASKTAAIITKGDICNLSSNKWQTAPTSGKGPFAVALETKAAADPTISLLLEGIVYLKAQAAVNPNARIMVSGTTAGQFIAYVASTLSGSVTTGDVIKARDEFLIPCGSYLAHENEGDGSTEATACADTEIVRCWFKGLGGA